MMMMSCALPAAVLSEYISDRAQCLMNVLALARRKPESCCQIGPALRRVSDQIMRNSKVVASALALSDSALHSHPAAAEKMQKFLESMSSIEAIRLRMRDFVEATIGSLLASGVAEPNSFAASQVEVWRSLMEAEQSKEVPQATSPGEMNQFREIFSTVLQYELALLESAVALARTDQTGPELAQLKKSPWHPSNIIFATDYDVTCTVLDSCYFMLQGNEAFRPVMARYEELQKGVYSSLEFESQKSEGESSVYWRERERSENQFMAGFDPSLQPVQGLLSDDITGPGEEISHLYNEAGLREALVKLANLEEICNSDIMSVGFLKGATREKIRARAKKVLLRPNCVEVLKQLEEVGNSVHIVSANWSRDVILGGLSALPRDKLFVHCNELYFDSAGVSQGTFDNTCVDAFDKEKMLRLVRRLPSSAIELGGDESGESLAAQKQQQSSNEQPEKMLVFLGDSPTDLLGLLEADLGIVFGESPRLRRLLSIYNIQLLPLAAATAHITAARSCQSKWSCRRSGILFEAQGWNDVEACLFAQVEITEVNNSASPLSSKFQQLVEDSKSQPPLEYDDRARDHLTLVSLDMIRVSS